MNENIIGWSIVGVLLIVAILVKHYCDRKLAKDEKEIKEALEKLEETLIDLGRTVSQRNKILLNNFR